MCRFKQIVIEGVVSTVEGFDYLRNRKEIIYASLLKKAGDEVGVTGTTATQLLGAYAVVKDYDCYKKLLDDVREHVRFLDSEGNNLVVII